MCVSLSSRQSKCVISWMDDIDFLDIPGWLTGRVGDLKKEKHFFLILIMILLIFYILLYLNIKNEK